eukprot:8720597-Pyramimonas_sp.AAC.1
MPKPSPSCGFWRPKHAKVRSKVGMMGQHTVGQIRNIVRDNGSIVHPRKRGRHPSWGYITSATFREMDDKEAEALTQEDMEGRTEHLVEGDTVVTFQKGPTTHNVRNEH